MLLFTIGDIARLAGITPKTLRHYHEIGLLEEPERGANNYRIYSLEHLEQLQRILQLKDFGLSLAQIKTVFESDNPDALIRTLLMKHQQRIEADMRALQTRLTDIQDYLDSGDSPPKYAAMNIVTDAIKPRASGVADVLAEVEGVALARLDRYTWAEGYDAFWDHVGRYVVTQLKRDESLFIFWMERYLALKDMSPDDLQGQAWLAEIQQSQARRMLHALFHPPSLPVLAEREQDQIHKLVHALLYEEASDLQKHFLKTLME